MGPQLLIDKSSLQSLTDREAFFLGRHYYLVVPPVLMAEIQADLEKARKSRKQKRARLRDSAADIARRLHCPEHRAFSLPRLILALESLRGRQVEMRGAPTLGAFVTTTELGEEVSWTDDTHEKTLFDWSQGRFSDDDRRAARDWRRFIAQIDFESTRRDLRRRFGAPRLSTPAELAAFVDAELEAPEMQVKWLDMQLRFNQTDTNTHGEVHQRWIRAGRPRLQDFAPYAWFCMRVFLLFHWAMIGGIIGTRATNQIDLEYLFYLPFCLAFTSGDRVHGVLAPLLLRDNQTFIAREALRDEEPSEGILDHRGITVTWAGRRKAAVYMN